MTEEMLTGSCLCGRVRFELRGAPETAPHCHCTPCQRRTGTAAAALVAPSAELEREPALLNSIAHYAPSLICLLGPDGRVRPYATNQAFERTLGYAPHETGGDVFWERYVAAGERAAARDSIRAA